MINPEDTYTCTINCIIVYGIQKELIEIELEAFDNIKNDNRLISIRNLFDPL